MPIPTHIEFSLPALQALAATPQGLSRAVLYERMAAWAKLTEADKAEVIGSGQETYKNRVGWACTWLRIAGLVSNPGRGIWAVTPPGLERSKLVDKPFTHAELRPPGKAGVVGTGAQGQATLAIPIEEATPDERINAAVTEVHVALRAQLLARLKANSPAFFERAVLRLLSAMGYGRFEQTGKSNDHGIDGVLFLDHFGLERVYVQAKRWEADVPRDRLQAFSGAMDEHHATKGVIVTTSRFADSAKKYVPGASKIIHRVDGDELTRLMLEHGVGVQLGQRIDVKRLDEDFFDE